MTQLRVAPLPALLTDPIRIASLARVVCNLALIFLLEVEGHALKRLVAREHHGSTADHDHTALGQVICGEWRLDIVYHALLGELGKFFFVLLTFNLIVYLSIEASKWSNYLEL